MTYHYFLRLGPSVRSILMSRAKFESLPKAGQDVIRKYSGAWLTERVRRWRFEAYNATLIEQLKSDPQRTVIFPSQSEIDMAKEAFRAVRAEWADASPHHRQLLECGGGGNLEVPVRALRSRRRFGQKPIARL